MHKSLTSRNIINSLINLLFLTLPLIFHWSFMESFYLPKRAALGVFTSLIAAIWLLSLLKNIDKPIAILKTPLNKIVYLYLFWSAFTMIGTPSIRVSLDKFIFLAEAIFLFFAALYFIDSPTRLNRLINIFIIAAVIVSVIGILQYYGLDINERFTFTEITIADKYSIFSTLGHPNFLASFLIAVLPVNLSLIICPSNFGLIKYLHIKRGLYILSFILISFCIYVSRSKGGWLGAAASIVIFIYGLLSIKNFNAALIKKMLAIFLICITLISALFIIFKDKIYKDISSPISDVTKTLSVNYSANVARLIIWKSTWLMIKEKPLAGFGYGTYNLLYEGYQGDFLNSSKDLDSYLDIYRPGGEAHNDYLQIAAETGVIGLSIFLWLIFSVIKNGLHIKHNYQTGEEKGVITLGVIAGIIAVLVQALVCFPLQEVPPMANLWFFIGIIAGAPFREDLNIAGWKKEIVQLKATALKFKVVKTGIYISMTIAFVYFMIYTLGPLYGSFLNIKAYNYMVKNNYKDAFPVLKSATWWYREHADMHLMLGVIYDKMGDPDNAVREYEAANSINPDYMNFYNIGLIKYKNRDEDSALKYFLESVKYHPDFTEGLRMISKIYKNKGEHKKYIEYENKTMKYSYRKYKKGLIN